MTIQGDAPLPTLTSETPTLVLDVPTLVATWQGKDHTLVLLKTDSLRVVFRSLQEGNQLASHKAAGDITVQVLDGHIEFAAADRTVPIHKGQILALKAGVSHSLIAIRPSAILITLASGPKPSAS